MEQKIKEIIEIIKASVGEDAEVVSKQIRKQGDLLLNAILIHEPGVLMTPTLYIDEMLNAGKDAEEIAKSLIKIHNELKNVSLDSFKMQISDFDNWEYVKDYLYIKLVNLDKNESYLQDKVYEPYCDMAVVPYVDLGGGAVVVTKDMCKVWKKSAEDIIEEARANLTKNIERDVFIDDMYKTLNDAKKLLKLEELGLDLSVLDFSKYEDLPKMTVISNKSRVYGASYGFIPYVLEKVAKDYDGDLIIIPSSVHEVIVLEAEDTSLDADYLRELVSLVNTEELEDADILSNIVFKYEKGSMMVERA